MRLANLFGHSFFVPADWLVLFGASDCRCRINSRFLTCQMVDKYRGVRTAISMILFNIAVDASAF